MAGHWLLAWGQGEEAGRIKEDKERDIENLAGKMLEVDGNQVDPIFSGCHRNITVQ